MDNDIDLSFILVPYHPLVYGKIQRDYQIVLEVVNKISMFALEKNIKFLGSYDPIKVEVDNSGFYDGMYCKEATIKKIMKVEIEKNTFKSLGTW